MIKPDKKTTRPAALVLLAGIFTLAMPQCATAQIELDSWGLRTSIPAWCMLSPGIGADITWNGRYMLAADLSYNHGSAPKNNGNGLHLSSIGLEARYYTRSYGTDARQEANVAGKEQAAYRGLYLGIDARRLEFNYKLSDIGRDGWAFTTGVLVGYTFILPKNWGIDMSAGCGYVHSDYTRYEWYPQKKLYRHTGDRVRNGFGLTNLNIALSYRFKL